MRKKQTANPKNAEYDHDVTLSKMVSSWEDAFKSLGWQDRLSLLEQLDENIEIGMYDEGHGQAISQRFTKELILRLKAGALVCREQAYVYLNSEDDVHREAARVWLAVREPNNRLLHKGWRRRIIASADKRTSIRHDIDLPGLIACNDHGLPVRLKDISAGGARVMVEESITLGTRVVLHVPLVEPVAASVAWLATTAVGLSFIAHQAAIPV